MSTYFDPFWYTFLGDFKEDEQARHEREIKNRLSAILERHKEAARKVIVVDGEMFSH